MIYKAVVIGVSAGGLSALKTILSALPAGFPLPIAIVQHIGERSGDYMVEYLNKTSMLAVKEAEDKEPICAGYAYIAPGGYHLLIEPDLSFSLSADPRVNFSCPAIDVLFESAADAYGKSLIGIVLTGANSDGSQGLKTIKEHGGISIVQNPDSAEASAMPRAAIGASNIDYIVELEQIAKLLIELSEEKEMNYGTSS